MGGLFLSGKISNQFTLVSHAGFTVPLDLSSVQRWQKWKQVLSPSQPQYLLLGRGMSGVGEAMDGYYVRILGETGIVGLGMFLGILALLQLSMWRVKMERDFKGMVARILFFGLLALMVQAVFIDTFVSSKVMFVFWLFAGIAASARMLEETPTG
jgi:hypothetical protein